MIFEDGRLTLKDQIQTLSIFKLVFMSFGSFQGSYVEQVSDPKNLFA